MNSVTFSVLKIHFCLGLIFDVIFIFKVVFTFEVIFIFEVVSIFAVPQADPELDLRELESKIRSRIGRIFAADNRVDEAIVEFSRALELGDGVEMEDRNGKM